MFTVWMVSIMFNIITVHDGLHKSVTLEAGVGVLVNVKHRANYLQPPLHQHEEKPPTNCHFPQSNREEELCAKIKTTESPSVRLKSSSAVSLSAGNTVPTMQRVLLCEPLADVHRYDSRVQRFIHRIKLHSKSKANAASFCIKGV